MTEHVLTLIAAARGGLAAETVDAIAAALARLGADVGRPDWLDEHRVCDLPFADLNDDQADAAARALLGDAPVDVMAQPAADRRKRLLIADMESTLIENEMLDELADHVGKRAEIAAITARAMNGELDFRGALDARVKLLAGLDAAVLDETAEVIRYTPGAGALIATMQANGARTAIVSGGFRCYTARVARTLGVDLDFGNELEVVDDRLTGRVVPPVLGREAKLETLVRLAAESSLPLSATLATGDGANDLDMIAAAGLGVAFRAKPIVAAQAKWRVIHGDLTALLYAQGYRAGEIVAG
ncbi:phosphoserine phosphatase SerB [Aliidongia dinghuensis]|uniref:Phosphoserine phosphatase n=1 Tax=Aliidongia dinghuensis TaxID=1867774 RepID=A0A8J3E0E8_9PROT|nr:phosphoserine phosphatase SerB [Aliidongia dinghuensis]GGF01198.1 phosphoserine phosphatase SerB [Aliidongia dinghuensis]